MKHDSSYKQVWRNGNKILVYMSLLHNYTLFAIIQYTILRHVMLYLVKIAVKVC